VVDERPALDGRCEALRVDLKTGKKETIFTRPFGDVDAVSPTADAKHLVVAHRTADHETPALEVFDLEGQAIRTVALPAGIKFLRGLLPLNGDWIFVWCSDKPLVIDVDTGALVAIFERGAREVQWDGTRLTLMDWGDEWWSLGEP